MKTIKFFIIISLLLPAKINLQADNRSEIYSAYVNNRMDQWKAVIDRMQASGNNGNEFILELVNYQYGYLGYCLGFNKEKEAEVYLKLAEKNISILESRSYKPSDLNAYRSAFYGFHIALNKFSAPVNGMKSLNHSKKALELDGSNYFAHVQYGNARFYMPSSFGGSKQEALESYKKARTILEKQPGQVQRNWNYLSLLVTIGQSYTYLGEFEKARTIYDEILKMEPGFLYVKNDLYPRLLSRMKQ